MLDVFAKMEKEADRLYQMVILIASLFNDARKSGAVKKEFMFPSQRLLVRAFAEVLGKEFQLCEGEIVNLTRDTNSHHGILAQLRFGPRGKSLEVRVSVQPHSWLRLPESEVWIDVMPPGSSSGWLSPVKYLPSKDRPAYTIPPVTDDVNTPNQEDVAKLSRLLNGLWQEAIGEGV